MPKGFGRSQGTGGSLAGSRSSSDKRRILQIFVYDDNAPEEEMDKQLDDNAEKRSKLYKYVRRYLNCYANLANSLEDMGYSEAERKEYAECAKKYDALKREIELRSNDHIDMRRYEPDMRQVLDLYVKAEDSEVIAKLDDTSFWILWLLKMKNSSMICLTN